ncbi:MAG: hypothetical protein V7849_14565 [Candidatus Competibacter sp.]|jgi:hypothetical protein
MKRSKLSMALTLATAMGGLVGGALFAPSAGAVNISAQGVGDVVIFPYYSARCSVDDCWQTLLNLTNTSDKSLAVKLRFFEGYNSREVLDFTVVLSPKDVFAGYVTQGDGYVPPIYGTPPVSDVPAKFVKSSGETTCTVPKKTEFPFSNFSYSAGNSDHSAQNDGFYPVPYVGPTSYLAGGLSTNDRGYEGYVVAIVMGHKDGEPGDCVAEFAQGTNGQNIAATASKYGEPINALKGNYNFLNVDRGIAAGGAATHLANFVRIGHYHPELGKVVGPRNCVANPPAGVGQPSTTNMFFNPISGARNPDWDPGNTNDCPNLIAAQSNQPGFDSLEPTLADAYPNASYTVNDDLGLGTTTELGPYGYGYLAVSEVLRAARLVNEWSYNTALGVTTEWVITHPTKNFFVDKGPSLLAANNARRFPAGFNPDWQQRMLQVPIPPFQEAFSGVTDGQSCNQVGAIAYDRSETALPLGDVGVIESPAPRTDALSLCFETNIIRFSNNDHIFESRLGLDLSSSVMTLPQQFGWLDMNLAKPLQAKSGYSTGTAINQLPGNGLPAIGFMIKQRALDIGFDTLKNYAYLADHAYLGRGIPCSKADGDETCQY